MRSPGLKLMILFWVALTVGRAQCIRIAQDHPTDVVLSAGALAYVSFDSVPSQLIVGQPVDLLLKDELASALPLMSRAKQRALDLMNETGVGLPQLAFPAVLVDVEKEIPDAGISITSAGIKTPVFKSAGIYGGYAPCAVNLVPISAPFPTMAAAVAVSEAVRYRCEMPHLFRTATSKSEWDVAYCAAVIAVNTTCRKMELLTTPFSISR